MPSQRWKLPKRWRERAPPLKFTQSSSKIRPKCPHTNYFKRSLHIQTSCQEILSEESLKINFNGQNVKCIRHNRCWKFSYIIWTSKLNLFTQKYRIKRLSFEYKKVKFGSRVHRCSLWHEFVLTSGWFATYVSSCWLVESAILVSLQEERRTDRQWALESTGMWSEGRELGRRVHPARLSSFQTRLSKGASIRPALKQFY